MILIRAILFFLFAFSASAQDASLRYAVMPDYATALALSQAAWNAVRCTPQPQCDAAQITTKWYPIVGLSDGTKTAIVIHTGDVFQGEHIVLKSGKTYDLTANQIASLQTRAQMGTQLVDILQLAVVNSRLLAAESTAITTYANAHASFKANYQSLITGPIDLQNPLTNTVFNELVANNVLTAARVAVILAPNAVTPIPN